MIGCRERALAAAANAGETSLVLMVPLKLKLEVELLEKRVPSAVMAPVVRLSETKSNATVGLAPLLGPFLMRSGPVKVPSRLGYGSRTSMSPSPGRSC